MEKQYEDSQKTKNRATVWSSNPIPGHIYADKAIIWKDKMNPYVHSSIIYNRMDLQMITLCEISHK